MFKSPLHWSRTKLFPWLLVFVVGAIYMWHFDNQNNDFQVFYEAGLAFRDGVNPWGGQPNPNAMYLNGSSTLLFFSILSFFPLEWAIFSIRALSLVTVVFAIIYARNTVHKIPQPQLIIFLFLSFPVRSALEYGQLTIIFSVIAFCILMHVKNHLPDNFLIIVSIALILDFKPHIFIGVVTFLILMRRLALLAKSFLVWLIFQIIVGLYCQIFPFIELLKAIAYRSETVAEGEDSFSIVSFFHFNSNWSTIIAVTSVSLFAIYSFKIKSNPASKVLSLVSLSLLITPLLHPTDLMLLLLVFIYRAELTRFGFLILGMFFVWSPQLTGAGFTLFVVLASFCVSIFFEYRFSTREIALLFLPNFVYLGLVKIGADEVVIRHSIHLFIPIMIGVYFSFRSSKIDLEVEKSG
jgi:hypothetical protein